MNNIHRILEEIRDIEETKTALVDELDRRIHARYEEVTPSEGEVWGVTLASERAHVKARNIPAIRTVTGWVTDPKWEALEAECHIPYEWEYEEVYPHYRLT